MFSYSFEVHEVPFKDSYLLADFLYNICLIISKVLECEHEDVFSDLNTPQKAVDVNHAVSFAHSWDCKVPLSFIQKFSYSLRMAKARYFLEFYKGINHLYNHTGKITQQYYKNKMRVLQSRCTLIPGIILFYFFSLYVRCFMETMTPTQSYHMTWCRTSRHVTSVSVRCCGTIKYQ